MKKFILLAACALTIGMTSCSKDDDGDEVNSSCQECEIFGIKTSVCDNGDGTAKVSADIPGLGKSEDTMEIPEGQTFEEFADSQCGGSIFGEVK